MSSEIFQLRRGSTPLIVNLPHVGTHLPEDLRSGFVERALWLEDTDWHLESLYDFVAELGGTLLRPNLSRYVIDLNRPPQDAPLYDGANNTELCPTRFFTGEPLYRDGRAPSQEEIESRRRQYWQPYHDALDQELSRLKAIHGQALLLDAHSIRSELPWLFDGKLPDLNLGTANGKSCASTLRDALAQVLASGSRYSHAVDGRFRGGYITRHYGRPETGIHAVQLEMCWSCYMEELPPYVLDESRAIYLRPLLREFAATMLYWASQHG